MRRARSILVLARTVHRAAVQFVAHDGLHLAQSAAYSAMIALFPALIVAAAGFALLPYAAPLRAEFGEFFGQVLPDSVVPLLNGYFADTPGAPHHTVRSLILAVIVSFFGASNVISTLMDGLHRSLGVPGDVWGIAQKRMRAFALVPMALLPLLLATVLVVFGQWITDWTAAHLMLFVRPTFFLLALVVRWTVALAGVVGLTAMIYHLGTPALQRRPWRTVLPGATAATALWFATTLLFGWYVTRFANYSQVYGSLGAGIALLLWLYIVCLSVLFGAEFNAQFAHRLRQSRAASAQG